MSCNVGRLMVSLCAGVALVGASLSAQLGVATVMSGLDNPRGLAIGPEGALYVAEAGRGGDGPCGTNAPGETRCYGATGAVSRLWRGEQDRFATGLPSHALPGGFQAIGPNDIAFVGRSAYVTLGLGDDASLRTELGRGGELFGFLLQIPASGRWKPIADVSLLEFSSNPGGGPIDTNPYGVLAEPGARIVADAGANALVRVDASGRTRTIAVFPSRAQGRNTDAVPTAVVRGTDGAYYVSELTGAPFALGAARIYRVVPGSVPQIYLSGFTTITDLEFDGDGNLYVVEHSTGPVFFQQPGRLLRVAPDGTREVVLSGLIRPTSVTIGWDGEVYVTNRGITPGEGAVLRIDP